MTAVCLQKNKSLGLRHDDETTQQIRVLDTYSQLKSKKTFMRKQNEFNLCFALLNCNLPKLRKSKRLHPFLFYEM